MSDERLLWVGSENYDLILTAVSLRPRADVSTDSLNGKPTESTRVTGERSAPLRSMSIFRLLVPELKESG